MRWYGPNNATLTVAGDINTSEVVKLVEKYFGSINPGPKVEMPKIQMTSLKENRYISYEDKINFPMLAIAYPGPPTFHPDEPAIDVLMDILGGGKTSIFYKNFIKTQKAMMANAFNNADEVAGRIMFSIRVFPDKTLAETEQLITQSLKEFEEWN